MTRTEPGLFAWWTLACTAIVSLTACGSSSSTCFPGFTTGTDTLAALSDSCTYAATLGGGAPTLTTNDSVHAAGNTLVITDTSSATSQDVLPSGLALSGVPRVILTTAGNAGADAGHRFDLSGFADVTRFDLIASGSQGDFLAVRPGVALTVQTASPTVDVGSGFASLALTGDALTTLSLTGTTGGVTLTHPAGPTSLTVHASGLALTGGIADASNHVTSLTIAGSGGPSTLDAIAGGVLASLTVSGAVTLGGPGSPAVLPASLTTADLHLDDAASYLTVQGSGTTVTLGNGNNQLTDARGGNTIVVGAGNNVIVNDGTAADGIKVGNGDNTIADHSSSPGGSITTGTGYNTIDLGNHPGAVVHLGPAAGFGSDPTTPNAVIANASAGNYIEFTNDPAGLNFYGLFSLSATSEADLIMQLEARVNGFADACAAEVWGGNTYLVHSATGTVGPTDTVIVKLIGSHGIGISYRQIQLTW